MSRTRFVARSPLALALGAALSLAGCGDEPTLPPEVEERARQREEADRQAREELEQKRREGRLSQPVEEPPDVSPEPDAPPKSNDDAAAKPEDNEVGGSGDEAAPPPVPAAPPVLRKSATTLRWEQMKAGMTTKQVVALLGRPTRIARDAYVDYWYYGQGRAAGRIAFVRAYETKTIAWDPPMD